MPPGKLDASVLIALGLTSVGCGEKDAADSGPCLDVPADTSDTGPCLEYATEGQPLPDTASRTTAPTPPPPLQDRAGVTQGVLARGVLPDDVAAYLQRRPPTHGD